LKQKHNRRTINNAIAIKTRTLHNDLPEKLIEIALPLDAINKASAYEKMPGIGPHPRGLHLWWARRPLAAARPVSLGTDFRLESRKVTGFALALDDQLLHISIFGRADGQNHAKQTSRMERYTHRRRNRRD